MTKTAIIGDFFLMYCEVQYCPLFKVPSGREQRYLRLEHSFNVVGYDTSEISICLLCGMIHIYSALL